MKSNNNKYSNTMSNNEVNSNPNAVSRIAVGMSILKGEIIATHDIRFDGDFDGKISSKGRIIIGEAAKINGEVICSNLDVWGSFEGSLYVKDTLALKSGCSVKGSLRAAKLVVELGSVLDGDSKMITEEDFNKICSENEFLRPAEKPVEKKAPDAAAHPVK